MAETWKDHQQEEQAEDMQRQSASENSRQEIEDIDFDVYDQYEDEEWLEDEKQPARLRDHRILRMRAPIFYGVIIGIAAGMMLTAIPIFYNDRLTVEIICAGIGYLVGKRCCGFPIFKSMKECEAALEEQKILEQKERRARRRMEETDQE